MRDLCSCSLIRLSVGPQEDQEGTISQLAADNSIQVSGQQQRSPPSNHRAARVDRVLGVGGGRQARRRQAGGRREAAGDGRGDAGNGRGDGERISDTVL
ncbi:hypothetical protein OH77DRAFT_375334 [Trametes cingulata]|nr:hypothetical protein OH77DRAFT_375334 [Trametes cingulata]